MKIWIWWYVIWLLRLLHCTIERDKMVKTEKIFKVVMFSPTAHALGKTGNFDGLVNFSLAFLWKHSSSRYFKRGRVMTNIKPINSQENGNVVSWSSHPFAVNDKFLVIPRPSSSLQIICTKQDEICMNTTITIYIIQRGWQCSVKEWRFSSYVCIERVRWIIYADRWWIIWVQQLDLKQRSLSSKEKVKTKLFVQSLYMFVWLEMSL